MKSEGQATDGVEDPLREAVTAVAAQISLAMQEAQPSVEQLGDSVSRMIVTLGSIRGAAGAGEGSAAEIPMQRQLSAAIRELRRDAAKATVTLQFYDRMVQNLTHLHDYLASVGELLAQTSQARLEEGAGVRPVPGSAAWQALREGLHSRLIPNLQRSAPGEEDPSSRHGTSAIEVSRHQPVSASGIELF
jgi:hypothetical protein